MGTARRFEDLEVFQDARELCKEVYRLTNKEPFNSDYLFCSANQGSFWFYYG